MLDEEKELVRVGGEGVEPSDRATEWVDESVILESVLFPSHTLTHTQIKLPSL